MLRVGLILVRLAVPAHSKSRISSAVPRSTAPWGAFALWAAAFLSGCTALTSRENGVRTVVTEPGAATIAKAGDFGLVGRVSVKEGAEGFSGGVQWQHSEDGDEILLLSPLGQTVAQIERTSGGVYLTTSEQESYYADDVEGLTERVLGWRLPLAGLQYWVQSINSPATSSAIDFDMAGRVVAIRQDGWEISYSGYPSVKPVHTSAQVARAQAARPKLLSLRRNGLRIKLVIDDWNSGTSQ
jgi:outer membrane lipoprotein LolB